MSGRTLDDMTQWGLDTLFNPSKRHMDEEKRRLQSTREEVGDSSGGKRIDFESGRVTIRKTDKADEDSAETTEAQQAEEKSADKKAHPKVADKKAAKKPADKKPAAEQSADEKAKRDVTPAAKRAAERRARLRK
jgi:membrane protein involved in colicin uptake